MKVSSSASFASLAGCRPERMFLCEPKDTKKIAQGRVKLVERLCAQYFVFVDTEIGDVVVQLRKGENLAVEDVVNIGTHPDRIHLF